MLKAYAYRNVDLCTKDCLCLYVCPTGATDTEDSIIDRDKCMGCGACATSCPSKAITMIPTEFPPQQKHSEEVVKAIGLLVSSKTTQERIAGALPNKLAKAVEKSNRLMAEDLLRGSGYMLPQSGNTYALLKNIAEQNSGEIKELATQLLHQLQFNEKVEEPEKWQCSICKYVHEGTLDPDFKCPVCKQPATVFIKL